MRISDEQLENYISLYQSSFGENIDKEIAYSQFQRLLTIIAFSSLPEKTFLMVVNDEVSLYNTHAVRIENLHNDIEYKKG